jgi:hypothetical protein
MEIRRKAAERLAKAGEQEAEAHEASMDKARFKQDKRERLRAANEEIVSAGNRREQYSLPKLPAASAPFSGFNSILGVQSSNRVESPDAGLMSRYRRNAGSRALADTPAGEAIACRMLTNNLLEEDSDELTRMANIYRKYGLMEKNDTMDEQGAGSE